MTDSSIETEEMESLRRIERVQTIHKRQRARLEADIESNPFHAGYSKHLVALMQREADVHAQGGDTAALAARLESVLAAETKRLFKFQTQRNQQRWASLLSRQHEGRQNLARQLGRQLALQDVMPDKSAAKCLPETALEKHSSGRTAVGTTVVHYSEEKQRSRHRSQKENPPQQQHRRSKRRSPESMGLSPLQFAMREVEMRAASAARWAENERFSLDNAFQLQLRRLEVDWSAHEAKLKAEYGARTAVIEARRKSHHVSEGGDYAPVGKARRPSRMSSDEATDVGFGRGMDGRDRDDNKANPWRSREKQPDTGRRRTSTSSSASSSSNRQRTPPGERGIRRESARHLGEPYWARAADRELNKLDAAFVTVMGNVQSQKRAAQRWIRRQRIRMEAQIEAVDEERTARRPQLEAVAREEAFLIAQVTARISR